MDKQDLILQELKNIITEQSRHGEMIVQLSNEIKAVRFEMTDRFNEIKRTIQDHHIENIKADELILKTLMDHKSAVTDELVTYEHHFNVVDKEITALKIDMDKLKHKL